MAGRFTTIGGQTRNRVARLNSDGSLDTSFNPNANSDVHSLAIQNDGKTLMGGNFTTVGGLTRNYVARLSADAVSLQSVVLESQNDKIKWFRSGAGPLISEAIVSISNDGLLYGSSFEGKCINGVWSFNYSYDNFPLETNFYLRFTGYHAGGYFNGSGSVMEYTEQVYIRTPELDDDELCVVIKAKNNNVVVFCL